jgi:hypothetical protein
VLLGVLMGGLILTSLGIMGEYLGRIYEEVQGRDPSISWAGATAFPETAASEGTSSSTPCRAGDQACRAHN